MNDTLLYFDRDSTESSNEIAPKTAKSLFDNHPSIHELYLHFAKVDKAANDGICYIFYQSENEVDLVESDLGGIFSINYMAVPCHYKAHEDLNKYFVFKDGMSVDNLN